MGLDQEGAGGGASNLPDLGDVDNAVSPTKGSILVPDGSSWVEVPVGADGEVLTADSAQTEGVKWAAGGGGGGGGAMTLLDTQTLAADATHIEFSAISGSYADLLLVGRVRSDRAATTDQISMRVGNGAVDTGSNYRWLRTNIAPDGTSQGGYSGGDTSMSQMTWMPGGTADADVFANVQLHIVGYADTSQWRVVRSVGGALDTSTGGGGIAHGHGIWRNKTDAIDVVRLFPRVGTNLVAGSRMKLYGLS